MKLWNYIFILTGISTLMALAGMDVAGITPLLKLIGVNVGATGILQITSQNTLFDKIFGTAGILTSIGIGGAIGVGAFIYTKDKAFITLPLITGIFIMWASVLTSFIIQKGGYGVFGIVLSIIGIVLTVGFIQSLVDYFMGVQ